MSYKGDEERLTKMILELSKSASNYFYHKSKKIIRKNDLDGSISSDDILNLISNSLANVAAKNILIACKACESSEQIKMKLRDNLTKLVVQVLINSLSSNEECLKD